MDILTANVSWMVWNSILAMLPVAFAVLYFRAKRIFSKIVLAVMWFLFLPNSLYVISDIEHLVSQWGKTGIGEKLLLLIQYIHLELIGLLAFIIAMYAFEHELRRIFKKQKRKIIAGLIISLNFLIGFAMVVGKVERVNSWDMFTATDAVIVAMLNILANDQLVILSILFGLFGNFFYFLFRDPVINYVRDSLGARRLTNKA